MAGTFTEFYCDPVNGSNLNAGSTNAAVTYTSAAGNWDGTSVFTPTDGSTPSNTVTTGMFASVFVTAGATVAVYVSRITAVGAGVNGTITLSTTAKSGTAPTSGTGTMTINVGGYWQGPNGATAFPFAFITSTLKDVAGDFPRVNFKNNGTYSITAAISESTAGPLRFQGMASSPGDGGKATIDGGTSGTFYVPLTITSSNFVLADFIIQNNGASGSAADGLSIGNGSRVLLERIVVHAVSGNGITFAAGSQASGTELEVYGANTSNTSGSGGFNLAISTQLNRCISHDNTGSNNVGFVFAASGIVVTLKECIADSNGSHGANTASGLSLYFYNCSFYNNGGNGILTGASSAVLYSENSIFSNNGLFGVNAGASTQALLFNCAFFSNTSGATSGPVDDIGTITLTGIPFTDAPNGDFSLNNTAGAGAACRNTGRGNFTQQSGDGYTATTTSFPDVGAVQHNDTGSTGLTPIGAVNIVPFR